MLKRRQSILSHTRLLFEQKRIDPYVLAQLYQDYNPLTDIEKFIRQSQLLFPKLNCGLASLYLQYVLGEGKIKKGSYKGHPHTFLIFENDLIADITADQFGGPSIYLDPLKNPWGMHHPLSP
jgi:hypothetical protein